MQGRKTHAIRPGDSVEYGCATSPYCGHIGTLLSIEDRRAVVEFGPELILTVWAKQLTWVPKANEVDAAKERLKRENLAAMREPLDSMLYEDDGL